ncbi:MAG: DNA repair protein RadC [Planctomycetaceae bacterium]|nr:DNA repair protein RadC [Planctomycetaceae bacterium]
MADKHSNSSLTQRYERYLPIVNFVSSQTEFEIAAVKQACKPEKPAFVTRLVNELVEQGWLIRESDRGSYQWNSGRGEFSPTKWLDAKLYGNQVQATPEQDRPRERLLALGAENLKVSELLAILIRSGRPGESAVTAGDKLAKAFDGRLDELAAAGRHELKSISPAIEKTAFCQIVAGIELGRRIVAFADQNTTTKIGGPADAMAFCQRHFARLASDAKQEEFHIVTLNTKNQVIATHQITVGTLDASLVHPREVFRAAIKDAASSVILVHNHPSGDPTPSTEDRKVTERLTDVGKTIGIEVLDHIVLGKGSAVSLRES